MLRRAKNKPNLDMKDYVWEPFHTTILADGIILKYMLDSILL